jgi:hypothetical protein
MSDEDNGFTTISVKRKTKGDFDALSPYRATSDDVLRALIKFWRSKNNDKPVFVEEAGA